MAIDLKSVMKNKMTAAQNDPQFKFQTIGDQIAFAYHESRTVTVRNEQVELVACEVLAGERFDVDKKKTVPALTGNCVFFPSTVLRRLISDAKLVRGDIVRAQFVELGGKDNKTKLFGFEVLERTPRDNGDEPPEDWPQ